MSDQPQNTINVSVHIFNDDAEYKDYDLYVDNIGGYDWKLSFYLDKESGEWTGLETQKSLPGEPYYECSGEEVPPDVMAAAEAKRLEIIQRRKTTKYIATVHLLIDAKSYEEACDAVSGLLTEGGLYEEGTALIDWAYIKHGQNYTSPRQVEVPKNYDRDEDDLCALAENNSYSRETAA